MGAAGGGAADLAVIPVCLDGDVGRGADLASEIAGRVRLRDGDVVVVSQKAVSKQEGMVVRLDSVSPSLLAEGIAGEYRKDPRIVELILSESRRIVRMGRGVIIVETRHGHVCANAGIDESNAPPGCVTLLPSDADASARGLRRLLCAAAGVGSLAVLVSDTFGRPFRLGQTDCAIGVSGMDAILDYRGSADSEGRRLRVSEIAVADEICAAAELVKGKAANCPASVVRNFRAAPVGGDGGSAGSMVRPVGEDLFR